MPGEEKKRTEPFFIDEKWYEVVDIVSSKINMLTNVRLLDSAIF